MLKSAKSRLSSGVKSKGKYILICGLGSLGQFCIKVLSEFNVPIIAIDAQQEISWQIDGISNLLVDLVVGDCRQANVLEKAKIEECRAVLLVTSNERVNIETAFAVRERNRDVRLVARSSKQNLNQLLSSAEFGLGNFIAYDQAEFSAEPFATRALGSENRGFIELDDWLLRVVKREIKNDDEWCLRQLYELNIPYKRWLLTYASHSDPIPTNFYEWEQEEEIEAKDEIVYIEVIKKTLVDILASERIQTPQRTRRRSLNIISSVDKIKQKILTSLRLSTEELRIFLFLIRSWAILWIIGAILLTVIPIPGQTSSNIWGAMYATAVMLLGAYDGVIGNLNATGAKIVVLIINFVYMVFGIVVVAAINSKLTEYLLSSKLELGAKRDPIPKQDHIVLIGLGRVGTQVAQFLQMWKQPLVAVNNGDLNRSSLPSKIPLLEEYNTDVLKQTNITTARGFIAATNDEMLNLEIGMTVHSQNKNIPIVIRTFDPRFSNYIQKHLPYAKVLCAYELSAEAFVAASFGENIKSLLRFNEQTVLVVDFTIKSGDTLIGLSLAEVTYGYGVAPILYQNKRNNELPKHLPKFSQIPRLQEGDCLTVLANIDGLRRIEQGERLPPTWKLYLDSINAVGAKQKSVAIYEANTLIYQYTCCEIELNNIPGELDFPLYKHQGQDLMRELKKINVTSDLIPIK